VAIFSNDAGESIFSLMGLVGLVGLISAVRFFP
jgi:hypothetical protein